MFAIKKKKKKLINEKQCLACVQSYIKLLIIVFRYPYMAYVIIMYRFKYLIYPNLAEQKCLKEDWNLLFIKYYEVHNNIRKWQISKIRKQLYIKFLCMSLGPFSGFFVKFEPIGLEQISNLSYKRIIWVWIRQ